MHGERFIGSNDRFRIYEKELGYKLHKLSKSLYILIGRLMLVGVLKSWKSQFLIHAL